MTPEIAVYSLLKADVPTMALVTGGIYVDIAKRTAKPSFVVFTLDDLDPEPTKDGASEFDKYNLEVAAVAKSGVLAQNLAAAIVTALDDYTGTSGGVVVDIITYKSKRGYWDPLSEFHIRELEFEIILKPSV